MLTKLFLIRHGQTDCNLEKRYSGFLDVDLNNTGRHQVELLHKRLKETQVHNVYSSDSLRAVHSARIVFKDFEIEKSAALRELHFGIFEGLTYEQIMKKYPRVYKKWLLNPFNASIPRGENLYNFQKRIIKAFKDIISKNTGKTIAVVCHGGVISIFINSILDLKDFWQHRKVYNTLPKPPPDPAMRGQNGWDCENCLKSAGKVIPPRGGIFLNHIPDSASLSIIEYKNNKPDIKLFNDTVHLTG